MNVSDLVGKNLGKYRIVARLGRGGMAEVYKGRHPRLDRTVAIKVLPARLANEADSAKAVYRAAMETVVLLLSPFAPHVAEELWQELGRPPSILRASWPAVRIESNANCISVL